MNNALADANALIEKCGTSVHALNEHIETPLDEMLASDEALSAVVTMVRVTAQRNPCIDACFISACRW